MIDKEILTLSENLEEFDGDYSNFDHQIPKGADEALRSGKFCMEHTAWDHWGVIWFQNGKFHETVWRYTIHVATISGGSIKEVVENVNDRYGIG